MVLYFLRHASAGQSKANPQKDEKRALDRDGIQQCGLIGRALAALEVQVDLIVSSPLKRAAQTAVLVGNEIGYEDKLQLDDALLPGADFQQFRGLLQRHARQESLMVVGHNPNLSEFLGRLLARAGDRAAIDLKKGAVAKVELDKRSASLHWCITPRLVRALQEAAASSSRPRTSRK